MDLVTFHFFNSLRHENLTSPVTVKVFTDQNLVRYCRTNEIAVAQRLARWTPDQAVWVPALVGVTACCSSTRHFTLTVLLSSHGHKWGTEKINAVHKPSIEYQFTRGGELKYWLLLHANWHEFCFETETRSWWHRETSILSLQRWRKALVSDTERVCWCFYWCVCHSILMN